MMSLQSSSASFPVDYLTIYYRTDHIQTRVVVFLLISLNPNGQDIHAPVQRKHPTECRTRVRANHVPCRIYR